MKAQIIEVTALEVINQVFHLAYRGHMDDHYAACTRYKGDQVHRQQEASLWQARAFAQAASLVERAIAGEVF